VAQKLRRVEERKEKALERVLNTPYVMLEPNMCKLLMVFYMKF